jgi:hypothetical protein
MKRPASLQKLFSLNMAKEQGFEPYTTKPKSLHLQWIKNESQKSI